MRIAPATSQTPIAPAPLLPEEHQEVRVPILELDGFHGHLLPHVDPEVPGTVGGAARISAEIRRKREEDGEILLLSGGDFFQGPPISTAFDGQPVVQVMNVDRFDAMTLGNHDFDKGIQVLASRLHDADFPILAANLLDARTGKHVSQGAHALGKVREYATKTIRGAKLAVVGLMKQDTARWTHPDNVKGLAFEDPAKTLERLVPDLMQRENPDVLVLHYPLLQHAPDLARRAQEAAREATGRAPFVLVVGGHNYEQYASPVREGDTMILEGTDRGAHVNAIDLRFDPRRRRVVGHEHERIAINDETPADPTVRDIVARYQRCLDEVYDRPVVKALTDLTRARHVDSPLGNLVTDVMRKVSGSDVAFLASGSIKSELPAGLLKIKDLAAALPFDNRLVVFELTGAQLKGLLEESASRKAGDKILQMSGLQMIYDPAAPVGQRVLQARLHDDRLIQDDALYRVAADDFLQAGGDNITAFRDVPCSAQGARVRDLVIEDLARRGKVASRGNRRVMMVPAGSLIRLDD